jgi:hypothetical protein
VWAPNRLLPPAYIVSLLACVALVGLAARRGAEGGAAAAPARALGPLPEPVVRGMPLGRAAAYGLAAGVVLGFIFAIRAGVVIAPLMTLVLWRGVSPKTLALAAGALFATVIPVLYLAIAPRDPGGYNSNYAVELIAAHWVGVAAVVMVGLALWQTLRAARR